MAEADGETREAAHAGSSRLTNSLNYNQAGVCTCELRLIPFYCKPISIGNLRDDLYEWCSLRVAVQYADT